MNAKPILIGIAVAVVLAVGSYGLYFAGMNRGMRMSSSTTGSGAMAVVSTSPSAAGRVSQSATGSGDASQSQGGVKAGEVDPSNGKKILYYHDPMVPTTKFDKPGKSPFMDMMLVPVYADGSGDSSGVTVSSRIQQNLGVRTAVVSEGTLSPRVSAVGSIAFNERDQAVVQARATGYVERLYVRATLDTVRQGQALVDLYVPDWIAAQEEYLSVRRMQGTDLAPLVDGARERMRQVGMTDAQIHLVERTGKTQPRITLTAPISGVVVELMVRDGMTVMAGAPLFRINGLSTVWANAEVPESQAALLRPGAKVQAKSPAVPGTTFDGKVQALLPNVDSATRTLKARLELANPGSRLVPGMFVQMQFVDTQAEKSLLVPTEAVIQTGKRAVVILAEDKGKFRPVDVQTGVESGGQTEIKSGLKAGQRVVVSSEFLIDSEASLTGVESRLNGAADSGTTASAAASSSENVPLHHGHAKIESVGPDALTLSHEPIASMKWGAMTMDFKLPKTGVPSGLRAGDRVDFEFYINRDGLPQLTHVTRAAQPGNPPMGAMTGSSPASAGSKR